MDPIVLRLRENGPIVIEGPVRVIDHLGRDFMVPTHKPTVALCRCGASATKPFCDGSHKRIGFQAPERAPDRVTGSQSDRVTE